MGTTVSNLHVLVSDSVLTAEAVAELVSEPALVAPAEGGWISVFPESEAMGDTTLAAELSIALGQPVVNFFCFDSDVSVADLVVDGAVIDQIVVSWPGYFEEMMGDAGDIGEDVPGGVGDDNVVQGVVADMQVKGDLGTWISTMGCEATTAQIVDAINADPTSPFADQVAAAIFGLLGVAPRKLLMAHRFYLRGEDPEVAATLLHT